MTAEKDEIGISHDILPPTDKKLEVRDKLLLVGEVLWCLVLILPCILHSIFRTFFPGRGKSLKGKVILVC
jgi:hypothetical protein